MATTIYHQARLKLVNTNEGRRNHSLEYTAYALVLIFVVCGRPMLIWPPNSQHRSELILINLLEVARILDNLQELRMLIVREHVLGAEAVSNQRSGILFVAERDVFV